MLFIINSDMMLYELHSTKNCVSCYLVGSSRPIRNVSYMHTIALMSRTELWSIHTLPSSGNEAETYWCMHVPHLLSLTVPFQIQSTLKANKCKHEHVMFHFMFDKNSYFNLLSCFMVFIVPDLRVKTVYYDMFKECVSTVTVHDTCKSGVVHGNG